nr:chondroitin sulfate proteoglycan 4 [Leptinotarsa decemlineata]XP_023011889.1 chondroitin sulfate proteoglycan 4 [Leptinotarsa decemlineata]
MEFKVFILCLFYSSVKFCQCIDQASFYGNSYISVPFKEAKSSTYIYFRFKTRLPNALMLLVAGTTDYCIIGLERGRIKVNINLGAGESELVSPSTVKLHDLKWHEVSIERKEANLTMVVDKIHKVQKTLPGKFFELNIHYGLFVGDNKNKNNTDIFFGHVEKFRGCISNLKYNDILVLEHARHRQSQSSVQGVTWNCAAEFDASLDHPISFIEDDAYMVLSQKLHYKEFRIHFEIRTITKDGLLFYNSGHKLKQDFFLIELNNYSIRALIKIGDKILKLASKNMKISDGEWHKVSFRLTSSLMELSVDEKISSEKNILGHLFQLSDISYMGGLEISKRFRASQKGCSKSCDSSFKGCLRHLSIFDMRKGLPDAHVTEGLLPGCVWQYPCLQNPCSDNGFCIQQGLDSFQCECQEDFCVNVNYTEGYKIFSKNSLATDLELLSVEPLQVLEGQSEIITTKNLHMILDYPKYGITDSGINFFIIEGPEHGSITIDIWPHEKNSFALFDIARDKVHYVHDGSENNHDSIVLEVEFSTSDTFTLPVYLQGKSRFSLSVIVIPTNDPPVLDISNTTVFRTVQGTKKYISSEIFKAVDGDNSPRELIYTILKSESGFFENSNKPGTQISTFTQEEVDEGNILFFDRSSELNTSYISMQVSDGIETSPVYQLRVSVSPQYWRLERNTGLIVLHQASSIITPYNLSFTSNVAIPDYSTHFTIVKRPVYGVIEVEKHANSWDTSDSFTGSDLKQHRVRYRHVSSKPDFDEFQFRTLDKTQLYTFRLTFAKCTLYRVNVKNIHLHEQWETVISTKELSFETKPLKPLTSIHYVIAKPPQYGFLFSPESKYKLRSCDMFTQEDIVLHNVLYRMYQKPYSDVHDNFAFVVLSPGCNNITLNLSISYSPSNEEKSKVNVELKHLQVDEGHWTLIDESHLSLQTNSVPNLVYNITSKPQNGFLQIIKGDTITNDTDYFSSEDLKNNFVHYIHDGSETQSDSFTFMALSTNEQNFEFVGQMNIRVNLKNDNSPQRVVDKVFHVVVGGERLLTGKDLKYTDVDFGTPTSMIVYTCRDSSNGQFYNVNNLSTKITEFTQDDLNRNKIIFKHKGPEYGKVRLWVTDGQFHVNGILEIQASAPFIHVNMNKKIIVEHGKIVVITSDHLSYSTNLYAFDKDVIYEVTNKPNFGKVVSSKTLKVIKSFTHEDIMKGHISYLNEHSGVNADEIGLKVSCRDAVNVAQLGVWMLPSNYWEPLEPKTLKKLFVEESTSVLITKNTLEMSQPNVPPSVIVYHIAEMPEYGYISILSDAKNGNEPTNVISFTQDLINENKVLYIQSGTNQTKDRIIFNVTNGIVWRKNVQLNIEIIPERLYLGGNDVMVNEGGITVLTVAHVFVVTEYYKSKITVYTIRENVKHGCIQIHRRCLKSKGFTQKELQSGFVQYSHDGTENLEDQLVLVAEAGQKKSVPHVLKITVLPVNDQKPRLINNTGLVMWEGGVSVITNDMLAAVDDDLPKETLKYQVQNCWWGSVSLRSDVTSPLNHFTQEQIDKSLVVFRHQNGTEARFKFNISDGLHITKDYLFHIRTKPVKLELISRPLHIFPLQKKYLTSNHLLTFASDEDRIIHYEVIQPPSLGRLMMESEKHGIFKVVSTFTQNDLNNSKVFYEHTHQFSDLYANDSFIFNVKAHLAPKLVRQVLKIDISVSSGGLDAYVSIPRIAVDEGGMTTIPLNLSGVVSFLENHAGLRAPIIHASAIPPLHGQIFLQRNKNLTTFTQSQLESGQVYYEHDHSDSLGDNIHFSLYLIPGYVTLCNLTVPVIVNPINDQPFNLVTPAPSLKVVQGENRTITRHELATEDADTPPSKLKYDLISGPSHGKLVLLPKGVPVEGFTQADIDNNKLVYIHEGSVLKDSFHFRIWDEKFRPEFNLFNIIVVPINISILAGVPVYLLQGLDVVFLSEKQFFIETNADKNKIHFSLKRPTKHGILYIDNPVNPFYKDNPMKSFTYADLVNKKVMYLQTDMTIANDSFRVVGEISSGNASFKEEVEVVIKVTPFMHIHNLTAKAGEINRISLHVLDATPLAKLTSSNPRYTIVTPPVNGEIRKIIRSSGEKRNVLDAIINSFTHEDIQSGLIFLAVKDIEVPWDGVQDSFVFMLAASIFQPAMGELKINIKSMVDNDVSSTLPGPSDPAGHEGGMHLAGPNMTKDYLLIVSMVVGVVVLGIAVIVVVKCRSLDAQMNKEEQCIQPIPLPRPPDRLMSSSPSLKPSLTDGFSTPISTTLPQCKVTPLSRSELDSPTSHACYPYGVDEQPDDWSSIDASDPPTCPSKNIMLRRNQYWV